MKSAIRHLAAIVVLYRPEIGNLLRIQSYANHLGKIIFVDNSEEEHRLSVNFISNCEYVPMDSNVGIARALNLGCSLARDQGFEYVLTMDQDSFFSSRDLSSSLVHVLDLMNTKNIAMVGSTFGEERNAIHTEFSSASTAITSGSLLRLSTWESVGGFDERLFIDQVDHEFSYRLRKLGHTIAMTSLLKLVHNVGRPSSVTILNRTLTTTNHHWIRRYYIMRNSLYLRSAYPEYAKPLASFLRDIMDLIAGIIFLERNKVKNIYALLIGALDYRRGRFGAWEENHK